MIYKQRAFYNSHDKMGGAESVNWTHCFVYKKFHDFDSVNSEQNVMDYICLLVGSDILMKQLPISNISFQSNEIKYMFSDILTLILPGHQSHMQP